MTMCVGLEVYLHTLLTSTLYEDVSSALLPMALPGGEGDLRVSVFYGDWWAPEPVWILEKKIFAPAGDRIPIPGLRSPRLKS